MAHCPPELLDDLAGLFAELRTWAGVVEKTRGVFYIRREPFLHFHRQADGRRRADVKSSRGWTPFELPRPLSAAKLRALLRVLGAQHADAQRALSTPAERRRSGRTAASSRDCARHGSPRPGS